MWLPPSKIHKPRRSAHNTNSSPTSSAIGPSAPTEFETSVSVQPSGSVVPLSCVANQREEVQI